MENLEKSVNLFKSLGDETRLKIIKEIFDESKSVSTIAMNVGMTQSAVSHQLQILKMSNIVNCERRGKAAFYSLSDEHVKTIVEQVFTHVAHK
ncbi:MAG: metalloregulator ArsR/SmtB family transcription factor [Bacilli bacterium]|nr:metalloregulator ArsR/SmtB family transcription factor [Candidatus Izemoplasmatales bacterium]MDD3171877.1 metalloregulator ArsR/SmtB family transcription factor [Bacilli bacterium]